MSLRWKLLLSFLALLVVVGAQGAWSVLQLQQVGRISEAIDDGPLKSISHARDARNHFGLADRAVRDSGSAADIAAIAAAATTFERSYQAFVGSLGIVAERNGTTAGTARVDALLVQGRRWHDMVAPRLLAPDPRAVKPVRELAVESVVLAERDVIEKALDALVEAEAASGLAFREDAGAMVVAATGRAALALGGVRLFGLLAAFLLGRMISRPILGMTAAMAKLAEGRLDIEVPGAGRRDEIGAMAKTVGVFKENALRMRELESQTEAERARAPRRGARPRTRRRWPRSPGGWAPSSVR